MLKHFRRARPSALVVGACVLSLLAASLNARFILHIGISVSHLTGDVSQLAANFSTKPDMQERVVTLAGAIIGFVFGAIVSGFVIHHAAFAIARPYGRSMIAIGLVVLGASWATAINGDAAVFFAASACGYQNAMATRFRGIIIRTTHITGLLTDFGQLIGLRLAGRQVELWKILLHLAIAVSFLAGSALGAALTLLTPGTELLIIGSTYVAIGSVWTIIKHAILREGHLA